jgi:hypothetical protein
MTAGDQEGRTAKSESLKLVNCFAHRLRKTTKHWVFGRNLA